MDFIGDYDNSRPRFILQSSPSLTDSETQQQSHSHPQSQSNKKQYLLFITITSLSSVSLLLFSLFSFQTEPFKSFLIWLSLSILLGPIAPSHVTGGHVRVGHGPIVEEPAAEEEEEIQDVPVEKKGLKKRSKQVKSCELVNDSCLIVENKSGFLSGAKKSKVPLGETENGGLVDKKVDGKGKEEDVWSEEDVVLLKKQMVKNPVGKPRRWEVIAEAFDGRFRVESVVKKAKELGERKISDSGDGYVDDSYSKFLKNRKPLDSRVLLGDDVVEERESGGGGVGVGGAGWNSGEDLALLNALKAFPKDAPMRWEKIVAAVPGKSKADCMKRVSELKKEFRSSKAAVAGS